MTIETVGSADIEVLPPARPAQSDAIGQLMAHAESMQAAKQLADALCDSELVPATYRGKPGNGAAAILYGAELGLNPIQSLQQIFVVHGAPAIYARTAVALVKRHGVIVETVSSTNDAVTVRAEDSRTGQVEQSTWDIPRAELAGYTSNKKYKTDPQAMLYAKAAMEVCRKIAPDVLLGIPYSREELELEQQPTRVRSERGGVGVSSLRQRAAQAVEAGPAQTVVVPDPGAPIKRDRPQTEEQYAETQATDALSPQARGKWVKSMFAVLNEAGCTERDEQLAVITVLSGRDIEDKPEHRDGIDDAELRRVVGTLGDWKKAGRLADEVAQLLATYVGVPMAIREQLDRLAQIQKSEKYDSDDEWFAYLGDAAGVKARRTADLTYDEAAAVISLFDGPGA